MNINGGWTRRTAVPDIEFQRSFLALFVQSVHSWNQVLLAGIGCIFAWRLVFNQKK